MDRRADSELWKGHEVVRLLELIWHERRYFQEIIASLPAPLAIVGPHGEILTSNRAFRELFQMRAGDPRSRIGEILPSPDILPAIRSAIGGGPSQRDITTGAGDAVRHISVTRLRGWGSESEGAGLRPG